MPPVFRLSIDPGPVTQTQSGTNWNVSGSVNLVLKDTGAVPPATVWSGSARVPANTTVPIDTNAPATTIIPQQTASGTYLNQPFSFAWSATAKSASNSPDPNNPLFVIANTVPAGTITYGGSTTTVTSQGVWSPLTSRTAPRAPYAR